jgi:hypothetical protein
MAIFDIWANFAVVGTEEAVPFFGIHIHKFAGIALSNRTARDTKRPADGLWDNQGDKDCHWEKGLHRVHFSSILTH